MNSNYDFINNALLKNIERLESILKNIEKLETIIEEKDDEIQRLNEELESLKQDLEDNYRPLTYAELVGVSDRDF